LSRKSSLTAPADETAQAQSEAGHLVLTEPRLGVPTFLWVSDRGPAQSLPTQKRQRGQAIETAARQHLSKQAARYSLSSTDVATAKLAAIHDIGQGAIIVNFRQEFAGVEVFREEIKIVMNRQLQLVAISGYITGDGKHANASSLDFKLQPMEAIALALQDLTGTKVVREMLQSGGETAASKELSSYESFKVAPDARLEFSLAEPVRIKNVLFHLADEFVPAYYLEADVELPSVDESPTSRYYAYVISAADGRLLFRNNLTAEDAFTYRVWADTGGLFAPFDGPAGNDAAPHPTGNPDGFEPPFVAPNLVRLQNGPISKNDPWLPPAATETVGNNVDAYADIAAPDGLTAGDFRANTTAGNTFDRAYDTSQQPGASQDQRMAAITQLFYVNNWLHDSFYDAGFDEQAGNAQADNYGRGQLGGDSLRAEAQDFSGTNNANMSTPADGGQPRMQMYVFNGPGISTIAVNAQPDPPHALPALITSVGTAAFGPQSFTVTSDVILVNDGTGVTTDGCQPIQNNVGGKIALIDRGTCTFGVKVQNAQAAGAAGVIIANNAAGNPAGMGGVCADCAIGALSVTQSDGNNFKTALAGGVVNVTLNRPLVINRDGTIDNQIVAHEWGHYLSNRLIANSGGLGNSQGRGMGEGWSDFNALLLTVRPDDALVAANADWAGVYALFGYAMAGYFPFDNNNYYFGIRRVPYSTNTTKDPLTLRHIANGNAITGVPCAFNCDGSNNAEVHNTGEVWATMLWECYAALLRDTRAPSPRLTFEEARERMRAYLVASLKLTPVNPTFTEARDALLAAAYANDQTDYLLFTQAFARRGAGLRAVAPDRFSNDHAGVVESYVAGGGDLAFVGATLDDGVTSCDGDGILDNNETGRLTITLKNNGNTNLSHTTATISSANPNVKFPQGATINFPASQPFQTVSASVNVGVAGLAGVQAVEFNIAFEDSEFAIPGALTAQFAARCNADDIPASSTSDDVESDHPVWAISHDPALRPTDPWQRASNSVMSHHWFGPDVGGVGDHYLVSPVLQVASAGNFTMSFAHRFDFERDATAFYDGGVIEISADGGASWTDIGSQIAGAAGYGGTLFTGSDNPLSGRRAFVGQSVGYPDYQTVTLDLGNAYAGQTVIVRFRLATDQGTGANGWEVDDIAFTNILNKPFPRIVDETGVCCPPITLNLKRSVSLWPPNHKYQTMTISQMVESVSDACGTSLGLNSVMIERITSDEPDNAPGDADGNTTHDILIAGDCKSAQVRAERDEKKNGRVYAITLRARDAAGNAARAIYKVTVPLNQSGKAAVQDGLANETNGGCP
jgi:hypothetical protein